MPKALKSKDRKAGPFFFVAVAVLVFALYSAAIVWVTVEDCGHKADKEWQIFPPEWECKGTPGFG